MKPLLLFLLFLLFSGLCSGQVDSMFLKQEFRCKVVDRKTNISLQFATVYNLKKNVAAETDADGFFTIKFERLTDTLITFYLGYKTDTTTVEQIKQTIYLSPIKNLLTEVEIVDYQKGKIINHPKITPLKFVTSDSLGFLLSERMMGFSKNYELEVFHYSGVSMKKIPIDHGNKVDIFKNCQYHIFLQIDDECIRLAYENQQFTLIEKMPYKDYRSLFGHCLASKEDKYIYQVALWNNLEKNYFMVNPKEEKSKLFKSIIHEKRLQSYMQDMGFIDYGKNVSTMEITDAGESNRIRKIQASSFLLENIIHKNHVINYFFALDSGYVFFNFDEKQIEFFDLHGDLKRKIADHPMFKGKNNRKNVLHDPLTHKFFLVHDTKDDFLMGEIDLKTNRMQESIALNLVYFKSIDIINGNVFSLGRNTIVGSNALFHKRLN